MITQTDTLKSRQSGFTLTELMVSSTLAVAVLTAALAVVWVSMREWHGTRLFMQVSDENSRILQRMVYGSQGAGGLREADGVRVVSGTNGWTLTYKDANDEDNSYVYSRLSGTIRSFPGSFVVCSNVAFAEAVTNPAGNGMSLRVGLQKTEGRFRQVNAMDTFVQFRNRHQE
jgi:prepilin-type N-terminal cleavage/methylation domain-containing protein